VRANRANRLGTLAALAAAAALSGCMGGPTYGTGVSANEQLANDVSNILALGPTKGEQIDYKPRPELVKPAGKVDAASLPAPQQAAADPAGNPQWPESPEARRARLRAEATANQDDPMYQPEVAMDGVAESTKFGRNRILGAAADGPPRWEAGNTKFAVEQRLKEQRQGDPTQRKYLSEPPLEYRVPAATAPTDQLGEDEWNKEKRRKAEAKKKGGGGGWFDWLPGV
jgi:hypothetical protein